MTTVIQITEAEWTALPRLLADSLTTALFADDLLLVHEHTAKALGSAGGRQTEQWFINKLTQALQTFSR